MAKVFEAKTSATSLYLATKVVAKQHYLKDWRSLQA